MPRGYAAGDDGITADLINDGACIWKKLATLNTQCLKASRVPVS